jgi:two-component sensor histidine kinase
MLLEPISGSKSAAIDLLAEANHRIANHLSMISGLARMQGAGLREKAPHMSGDDVRSILEEFGARLETVARLHRLLASGQQRAAINLADYLREVAEGVVSCLSFAGKTELRFACDASCLVAAEKAAPLGLLVGELLTNSIKYAHPTGVAGQIRLECRKLPRGIVAIEVADDGVGLPDGFDPLGGAGMGFRLVRTLAAQLGAAIDFDNNGLGLCFALQMPTAVAELKAI